MAATAEQLHERLQAVRFRRRHAERELNALTRQTGLAEVPKKLLRQFERVEAEIAKYKEEEGKLQRDIEALTQPPPAAPSGEATAAAETAKTGGE